MRNLVLAAFVCAIWTLASRAADTVVIQSPTRLDSKRPVPDALTRPGQSALSRQ
jgi:hypothetical protein